MLHGKHTDPFRFRFDMLDLDDDCEWSMRTMSVEDHCDLLKKLSDYETKSPSSAIQEKIFKIYENFGSCPNKCAVHRLLDQYPTCDAMARFRLSGSKRLYGIVDGNEFHVVWWDPDHLVWPSSKKHT